MKMMQQMACAALAAAFAVGVAGCGSKDYSKPKVADGTVAAIVVRPAENTSLAPLCKQYGLGMGELMKQVPDKDFQEVLKELELDKAQYKWLAVTFSDVSPEKFEKGEPDFAVAVSTTLDLDNVIAVAEKYNKEQKNNEEIKKITVAGVPAYEVVNTDKKKSEVFLAGLDKQLILIANTSANLEKLVALYHDDKGASADFGSFTLGANDVIRLKVTKVGENVKKALPSPDALQMVNGFVPDGDKMILGMGAVELALAASGDGKNINLDLSLDMAADADADKLVTVAKTGLMALTAQMKEGAEKDADSKAAYEALQAVKIEAKGKVATLTASTAADAALKALADKAKELK